MRSLCCPCVCVSALSLIGNGSPVYLSYPIFVVFYAVRVISKENRRLAFFFPQNFISSSSRCLDLVPSFLTKVL
jgi:hypothetical protein